MQITENARQLREAAAAKYRPSHVKLLLVAEAPPCTLDRYFYFEEVKAQDSLFRYVCKGLFGVVPPRDRKTEYLSRLRESGVHLIDVCEEPIADGDRTRIRPEQVIALIDRCRKIGPDSIILIKSNVYDLTHEPLAAAGFEVANVRMPFPGSGQQGNFERAFAEALKLSGFRC
ncbi:MAG: hypothetical protein QM770_00320 [Tepidisphaeraceae bacterium]